MSITKRQKLVDQFNNPEGKEFIFLLSSKAGGCGINLIGANRLILFDPGMYLRSSQILRQNSHIIYVLQIGIQLPINKLSLECGVMDKRKNVGQLALASHENQCLTTRVRTGFVYRFISTGTIEEKIFQRQANKQALSSAVVDEKEDTERHFTLDALRQLFLFNEKTLCETHETFKCKRCKNGRQMIKSPALLYGDASTYVFPIQ